MPKKFTAKPTPSETVQSVYKDFIDAFYVIQRPYPFLDNVSPISYWNDARKRFNGVLMSPASTSSNDWKSKYVSDTTRTKIIGLAAHLVSMYMSPSIVAQNSKQMEDKIAALFLKDYVEYSLEKEKWTVKQLWAIITVLTEGTCTFEENYGCQYQDVKDITDIDYKTGEVKWDWKKNMEVWKGAFFEIVPNDMLLLPDPYLRDIQDQDYVIRYYRMSHTRATKFFGMYPNWDKVKKGAVTEWAYETDTFKRLSSIVHLKEEEVFIVKRYRLSDDSLDIIANGEQLTAVGNPIPRPTKRKRYPFVRSFAEPIDNDFFMGKSMTDRLQKEQDAIDLLMRIFINREFLKNVPPVTTTNEALLNEDLIIPGNVIHGSKTDSTQVIGGLFSQMDNGLQNLIQFLQKGADESSINALQLGQSPAGGNPTATQTLQMAKNAQILLNMFNELQRHAVSALTEMRVDTLLWMLDKEDMSRITIHDRILKNGRKGSRAYFFENGLAKTSESNKEKVSTALGKFEKANDKMDAVAIDPEALAELDYYVRIDAEPQPRRTDDLNKIIATEKFNTYALHPEIFNLEPAAEDLAMVFGDDPDEVVKEAQPIPPTMPGQPQGMPTPQGGLSPLSLPQKPSLKRAMGLQPA